MHRRMKALVFRDSFAASLLPLLAEGYSEITLADIRYLSPSMLGKFIDFTVQDVLFLYSTSVPQRQARPSNNLPGRERR